MGYINTSTRTTKPTSRDHFQPAGRSSTLFGVFLGFIKDATDVQRNGRLRVWIPELGSEPENSEGWVIVNYCSPFAGATNVDTISRTDTENFDQTQTSYGMWMIPPDINNEVLVMFINGDPSRGVWIGCLYNQFMNNMVPGMASDIKNWQYPGKSVPIAEYNKWDTAVTEPDRAFKPYEKTKFKGVGNQGLITDKGRGITTSSARREAPSNVFGILTPGPVIDESVTSNRFRRKGGSSFIMDDGGGSEYVQLATKTGAQIRLDETNGFVYLINRDGTAWVQMDQKGNIDIFGATDISMRAQRDFNIRADRNINIEAGQNIFVKAAKDTKEETTSFTYDVNNKPKPSTIPVWNYKGEGKGDGGNIVIQALNNTHTTVSKTAYLNVGVDWNINVVKDYVLTTDTISIIGETTFKDPVSISTNLFVQGTTLLNSGYGSNWTALLSAGPGAPGAPPVVPPPPAAAIAEVKPLIKKANILATWSDPQDKFKRISEALQTTVSRWPTYEPCPEHETFSFANTSGYQPEETQADKTYIGSGGAGNISTSPSSPPPATNTTPGANNTDIKPPAASESVVTKDFNMAAYECQLKINEGVKYTSYYDSKGLPTAGIGHLLRANEIPKYPVPTKVPPEQVAEWFQADAASSIAGAQRVLGMECWDKLTDERKRAAADLCFNMGEAGLSKFKTWKREMQAGNYDAAGEALRNSLWFTQVANRGPRIIEMIKNSTDPLGCNKKFPKQ